jgi:hypothetical protein
MTEPYPESLTEGLIPPCVSAYRFNMNIGGSLVLPSASDPVRMTVCIGIVDPWCEGGYIDDGPDGTIEQATFTAAVARICTARQWCKRVAGNIVKVEILNQSE